ncbi:hypothetical protein H5410_032354 [Solanum commersonii]|uniref:Uncharacterized protein n=1 Tax=Solanum commersonii TaxID=4109 RepID=A0A9J5YMP8_SOLCO|nr:hypothetical protein H5410_032354 [Solanum commersonii]
MEFINLVRTTLSLLFEKKFIIHSHVYASNTFLLKIYHQLNLRTHNMKSSQHASSQNVILRSPICTSNIYFSENSLSTQPLASQMLVREKMIVWLSSQLMLNHNHPIRNDKALLTD